MLDKLITDDYIKLEITLPAVTDPPGELTYITISCQDINKIRKEITMEMKPKIFKVLLEQKHLSDEECCHKQ